jgi:hypothetical protein
LRCNNIHFLDFFLNDFLKMIYLFFDNIKEHRTLLKHFIKVSDDLLNHTAMSIFVHMRWTVFLFFGVIALSYSQSDIRYEDFVYLPHIKSVKFHHEGLFTSDPIIDLNSGGGLILTFDDILGGDIRYNYKVIHCDKDWKPSDLDESEYIDGFNDEDIRQSYYSAGTIKDYTHYQLRLPNDDINWRLSGNYLLVVMDDEEGTVAITRRFMVVESRVSIAASVRRAITASLIKSHHQIDLNVNHKNYDIINPQRDIFVTILQNGRWDNALTNVQPKFVNGFDINFDFTNQLLFPAGKEFRFADLRNTRYPSVGIQKIERRRDGFDVLMELDQSRHSISYFDYDDLNGDYIIQNLERSDENIQSEYLDVHFGLLDPNPPLDGDVYLIGKFSDWRCLQEYRMDYSMKYQGYFGSALLKQGYYDYQYVVKNGNQVDYERYEGNQFRTSNDYLILVYYRSFGDRYDRLIGVASISSDF